MKTYTLKEVSEILHIPKSTLRYWEEEGLIHAIRNEQNEYREYSTEDLITIADIAFYRSLHMPVKALKNLYQQSIEENMQLLKESSLNIQKQVKELQKTQRKINQRLQSAAQYARLSKGIAALSEPPFHGICHLHMLQKDNVLAYLEDKSILAVVLTVNDTHIERYGIIKDSIDDTQTYMWEKKRDAQYIPCMLRIIDRAIDFCFIQDLIMQLQNEHKVIGKIIGSYLVTDRNIDYFQAWIEVLI